MGKPHPLALPGRVCCVCVNRRGMLALTQIRCKSFMSRQSGGLEEDQAFRDRTFGASPA